MPFPKQDRSDCFRWACTDPNYTLLVVNPDDSTANPDDFKVEYKRTTACPYNPSKPFEPHTIDCLDPRVDVQLVGPTTIVTDGTCTWSAEFESSWTCPESNYRYQWYAANQLVGTGQSYEGGRPAGVPAGSSWPLRVVVTYGGTTAGSGEIWVSENERALVCFH